MVESVASADWLCFCRLQTRTEVAVFGTTMDCALLATAHHVIYLSKDVFRGKHNHSQ